MAHVMRLSLAFFLQACIILQTSDTVDCVNGPALQLFDFKGTPSLNVEALATVFDNPICRDRPVVVVSMAGDYRKGKSFMLNMFLKYLTFNSQAENKDGTKDWLADGEKPFEGFSSRGGIKRDTTGILIWPEPFLLTLPSGEEVAVVILDTQGTFDSQSTIAESTQIFALSTMISSIQIYNQFNNIQENDLQHLSLFVEYGAKALAARPETDGSISATTSPFQKLVLLVRDWRFEDDYPSNEAGSKAYLNDFLSVTSDQEGEHQVVRQQLKKCFSELDCVLLPQPGSVVEKGRPLESMAALEPDFRRELRRFVQTIFSPERLMVKTSSGRRLTGHQLAGYIKSYCDVLSSGELPSPASMWRATAEVDHRLAVEEALHSFKGKMDASTGSENPLDSDELDRQIAVFKGEAMVTYAQAPKMEDDDVKAKFTAQLAQQLEDRALSYLNLNRSRRERVAQEEARREAEARAAREEEARQAAELAAAQAREEARILQERLHREQQEAMERARIENEAAIERARLAAEAAQREAEARAAWEEETRRAAEAAAAQEREAARQREEMMRQEQNAEMERLRQERQRRKRRRGGRLRKIFG